jgi:hypothetical protein
VYKIYPILYGERKWFNCVENLGYSEKRCLMWLNSILICLK